MHPKVSKRFIKAIRNSELVSSDDLERALEIQDYASRNGRELPLDRILLKLNLLEREQILGLWRALRYYVWRKEDKFYAKLAVQSQLLTEETARLCLKEQKKAYKHTNELVRVNEIARQRGYLNNGEDLAIVRAMREKHADMTIFPVDEDRAAQDFELASAKAAPAGSGKEWRDEARRDDLDSLKAHFGSSGDMRGISDEDLDALWEEADLDDVELDSQAMEIARTPMLSDDDIDIEELDDDLSDLF